MAARTARAGPSGPCASGLNCSPPSARAWLSLNGRPRGLSKGWRRNDAPDDQGHLFRRWPSPENRTATRDGTSLVLVQAGLQGLRSGRLFFWLGVWAPSNPAAGENEGSEHPVLRPCSLSTMGRRASFNQSLRANFRHPEKTNPRHPRPPSNKPNKLKARTRKTNPENTFPLCFAALRLLFPNPENRFVPDFVPDLPGFLRGPVRPQPHILP